MQASLNLFAGPDRAATAGSVERVVARGASGSAEPGKLPTDESH
jgi:hypothetical protein